MIEETALVVASDNDFAIVETQSRAACGSCSSGNGCSTSVLAALFKRRQNRLRVLNPIQAAPGQRVVIGLQERALVSASLMAYLVPLVSLLLGAIVMHEAALHWGLFSVELGGILGGLLGLILGFIPLTYFSRHSSRNPKYQAVVLRREMGTSCTLDLS